MKIHWQARYLATPLGMDQQEPAVREIVRCFSKPATPQDILSEVASSTREQFEKVLETLVEAEFVAEAMGPPEFDRPVFIIACPRSGSTLLFETLARSSEFWSLGKEAHHLFSSIPSMSVAARGFRSVRLTERDADGGTRQMLREGPRLRGSERSRSSGEFAHRTRRS